MIRATVDSTSVTFVTRTGLTVSRCLLFLLIVFSLVPLVQGAKPPQLSGTILDTSGSTIAGATVLVRSANGAVQMTTQSDTNGFYRYF